MHDTATHLCERVRRAETNPPSSTPAPMAEISGKALAVSGKFAI